jgi:MFS family permease
MPATAAATARFWPLVLTAAAILMVTMGIRQTTGLYLSPINTTTGLGIAALSFAMAVGQLCWGVSQPVAGALADRFGAERVIVGGGLLMAAGLALTALSRSEAGFVVTLGVLAAAGAGAGSLSILLGASAQRLPAEKRPVAAGAINAGGSFGQFVFAPINQALISTVGWINGMWVMAVMALLTLPLAGLLGRGKPRAAVAAAAGSAASIPASPSAPIAAAAPPGPGMRAQVRIAFADRSYWWLHAGFFTCGFHIAFLVTHLPGEVALCGQTATVAATSIALIGLANIAGSLTAGALGNVMRMKMLLFWTYFARAAAILVYLAAPKTPVTFYIFALVLGFTWLSTVPPTAGLVGKLFGVRYLATLFGLTMLSHQIGAFFGAWLGGLALSRFGDYTWMWWADAALALGAALINLPIREAPVLRRVVAA